MVAVQIGDLAVEADFIEALLAQIVEKFPPEAPITLTFRKAHFASGHDLQDFAGQLELKLGIGDVEQ